MDDQDNNYGPDFVTITSEDGEDIVLEFITSFECNGNSYSAFYPTDVDPDSEEYGIIILRHIKENGDDILSTPETDEELNDAYNALMKVLFDEEEED